MDVRRRVWIIIRSRRRKTKRNKEEKEEKHYKAKRKYQIEEK